MIFLIEKSIFQTMGKTKELTAAQRGTIFYCHKRGDTFRTIADTVGCSLSAVSKTLKRYAETGSFESKTRSGRTPQDCAHPAKATKTTSHKFQINEPAAVYWWSASVMEKKNAAAHVGAHDWPRAPCNGVEKLHCTEEAINQRGEQGGPACMVFGPRKLDERGLGEGALE